MRWQDTVEATEAVIREPGRVSVSAHAGPGIRKEGRRTPESEFREPLLVALLEFGGRARTDEVVTKVGAMMKHRLTGVDREPLRSGEVRWRNMVCWTRKHLVMEGLLRSDSPRGIWELTEAGRIAAERCLLRSGLPRGRA